MLCLSCLFRLYRLFEEGLSLFCAKACIKELLWATTLINCNINFWFWTLPAELWRSWEQQRRDKVGTWVCPVPVRRWAARAGKLVMPSACAHPSVSHCLTSSFCGPQHCHLEGSLANIVAKQCEILCSWSLGSFCSWFWLGETSSAAEVGRQKAHSRRAHVSAAAAAWGWSIASWSCLQQWARAELAGCAFYFLCG